MDALMPPHTHKATLKAELLSMEGFVSGHGRQAYRTAGRFLRGGDGTPADTAMRMEVFAEVSADLSTEVIALAEGLVANYAISSGTITRVWWAIRDYHDTMYRPAPLKKTVLDILGKRRVEVSHGRIAFAHT